ncbi:MAG TPA: hypothetical protein VMB05_15120 [Solirubrobacteraceae bacterium]|nr:hypothetical protein [Solirubrobacteraceae bacterium]
MTGGPASIPERPDRVVPPLQVRDFEFWTSSPVAGGWQATMVTASGSSWTEPEIENGTVTIMLPDDENIGRYKARQVLWAARPLAPSAYEFKAYKGDHLIASFASEAIDRWQAASDAEQPLLMIEALRRARHPA